MIPAHDTVVKIGSQELIPIGEHYRFVIEEVLPHKGFKFKFSIRDKIIDLVVSKGKRLEVRFKEFPDLSFNLNPIEWLTLGKKKKEIKLFKNFPMILFYYFVGFNNELAKKPNPNGQGLLI